MCDFLLLEFEGEMCLILKKLLQKTTCTFIQNIL